MTDRLLEIDEATVPLRESRVANRVVEGVAVVVVLDSQRVYRLDPVGTRIWELCDGRSCGQICDQLVAEFEVARTEAFADLADFVRQLHGVGALSLEQTSR